MLANRLKKVLGKVVSADQKAFGRGRQILDASLIANEVVIIGRSEKRKGWFANWILKRPMIVLIGTSS